MLRMLCDMNLMCKLESFLLLVRIINLSSLIDIMLMVVKLMCLLISHIAISLVIAIADY
jgi:hypothetical protein